MAIKDNRLWKAFVEWEGMEVKDPPDMTALAVKLNCSPITLYKYREQLRKANTGNDAADFIAHVRSQAMKPNATAPQMALYARLTGIDDMSDEKETNDITASERAREILTLIRELDALGSGVSDLPYEIPPLPAELRQN